MKNMTPKEFEAFVMFKLLDTDIPKDDIYIAADSNGDVFSFPDHPNLKASMWNGRYHEYLFKLPYPFPDWDCTVMKI